MATNNIRFGAFLDDHVSSNLSKMRDNFDRLGKGAASASLIGNVGAKALAFGVSLAATAVSKLGGVMADAVQDAIADEESQARLGAALKANVPGWNSNTAAIEANIKTKQRLGFADDELRDSLSGLLGATHNVAEAQDIQNTAMDLARFKNISLSDASEALTKVEAGSYRILKSLGIVLKDGATQTDALAAVQAVAQGQAEAYAETNRGKLLASQVAVNEAMEDFGTSILPVVIPLMLAGADKTREWAGYITAMTGEMKKLGDASAKAGVDLTPLTYDLPKVFVTMWDDAWMHWHKGWGDATWVASEGVKASAAWSAQVVADLDRIGPPLRQVSVATIDMGERFRLGSDKAKAAMASLRDSTISTTREMIDGAFDPTITKYQLMATNSEIAAARRVIASSKSSAAEILAAKVTLASLGKDQAGYVLALAQAGETGSTAYQRGIAALEASIKTATGTTKTYLTGVLNQIREIERVGKVIPLNFVVAAQTTERAKNLAVAMRAKGGPINAGEVYQVGEQGPEWFVSDKAGEIIPNGGSAGVSLGRSGGWDGGGVPVSIPVYLDGRVITTIVDRNLYYRSKTRAG